MCTNNTCLRIVRYTYACICDVPAILALRLYINRKDGKPDRYLGFMVSHLAGRLVPRMYCNVV